LEKILHSDLPKIEFPNLLVGHQAMDDAAAVDLGDGRAVLSTTDFFMPIVDDPHKFGRIAASNSLSDIYAMGGQPIMAIGILGWPASKIPPEIGAQVLEGGRAACNEAGIPLAGGHSIDSPEPFFGLAVTGIVDKKLLKTNSDAKVGDKLYLTKALGIGILTTAEKKKKIEDNDLSIAVDAMCELNKIGAVVAPIKGVNCMTDITGFGLGGHLIEVCQASQVRAELDIQQIPLLNKVAYYQKLGCVPGGTQRNFESYQEKLGPMTAFEKDILFDPQTSGGLLITVAAEAEAEFLRVAAQNAYELKAIGQLLSPEESQPIISLKK
jgi:selenide, water dikinase